VLGVLALLAAGFSAAVAASPDAKKPPCKKGFKRVKGKCVRVKKKPTTPTKTTPAPGTPPAVVYYEQPSAADPGQGTIKLLGGSSTPVAASGFDGFTAGAAQVVWVTGNEVHVASSSGERVLYVDGLLYLRNPSLSPDGKQLAVDGTQTPGQVAAPDEWRAVYLIDLATGAWRLFAPTGSNPFEGNDLPVWLANNELAYESTESHDGTSCLVVNIADAASGAVKRTLRRDGTSGCETPISSYYESPRTGIAFTRDSSQMLLAGTLQVVVAQSGALLHSVQAQALAGLKAAGYAPDDRYPPRTGTTTAALSGAFSPDGKTIVFDGAVHKGNVYSQLLMQIGVDGTGFKILAGPFVADEPFVSGNAYSLLHPLWKP
jgi:hypothetical protein